MNGNINASASQFSISSVSSVSSVSSHHLSSAAGGSASAASPPSKVRLNEERSDSNTPSIYVLLIIPPRARTLLHLAEKLLIYDEYRGYIAPVTP